MKAFMKSGAFLIALLIVLQSFTYILRDKTNAEFLYTFRDEPKNSLDVLLFGSSHMYAHVSSLDLWREYGITSYNLGTSEQTLAQSHELLRYALEHQSPKLVVLEVSLVKIKRELKGGLTLARDHQVADNLIPSIGWLNYIRNTVESDHWVEFLFPIAAYHERWRRLSKKDFQPIYLPNKGVNLVYTMYDLKEDEIIPANRLFVEELPDHAIGHIQAMHELCKEHGAELLLSALPYPVAGKFCASANAIFDLSEQLGVNYLYLLDREDELGLDYKIDVRDSHHFNMAGTMKITKYVGNYIKENYEIPDRRLDPKYAYWHDDYKEYKEYAVTQINKTQPLEKNYYLSCINHEWDQYLMRRDEVGEQLAAVQTIEEYLAILQE